MAVHAIYGSQLGDYEWDIGKTIRWHQFLVDTGFAVDTNSGDSRNWVVSWDATYPEVKYTFQNEVPFFTSKATAAEWRRRSFVAADKAWNYADNDWVMFIDASECLAINDTTSNTQLTAGASSDPFKKWLRNASTATPLQNYYAFPQYAYMRQGPYINKLGPGNPGLTTNITGTTLSLSAAIAYVLALDPSPGLSPQRAEWLRELDFLNTANTVANVYAIPSYAYIKTVVRFFRVGFLRSSASPEKWSWIDDSDAASDAVPFDFASDLNIISYAYARWAEDPLNRDRTTDLPLTEALDTGFVGRKLMSRLFSPGNAPGVSLTWSTADTATLSTGPSKIDTAFTPSATGEKLRTPAYYNTFRMSLRDGLYYRDRELGPVPWDHMNKKPAIDPSVWVNQ